NIIVKPETVPPLVIGVYGPWGSGKSTLMDLIRERLDVSSQAGARARGEDGGSSLAAMFRHLPFIGSSAERGERGSTAALPKLITVRYDAWAYTDASKLWAGLVGKFERELDRVLGFWGCLYYLRKLYLRI